MKLAFYSDQILPQNRNLDALVVAMLGKDAKIGFVPSSGDSEGRWFEDRRTYYAEVGLRLSHSHDPIGTDKNSLSALLACDAIHLSGGKTQVFLARLERGRMIEPLRNYARRGGLLIGVSAGAILLTPTIRVNALFSGEVPNDSSPESALDLVNFEFFPHLYDSPFHLQKLVEFSCRRPRTIFGCPDGSGIIVEGPNITFVGDGLVFEDGHMRSWNQE